MNSRNSAVYPSRQQIFVKEAGADLRRSYSFFSKFDKSTQKSFRAMRPSYQEKKNGSAEGGY